MEKFIIGKFIFQSKTSFLCSCKFFDKYRPYEKCSIIHVTKNERSVIFPLLSLCLCVKIKQKKNKFIFYPFYSAFYCIIEPIYSRNNKIFFYVSFIWGFISQLIIISLLYIYDVFHRGTTKNVQNITIKLRQIHIL